MTKQSDELRIAVEALQWIADHETDEGAIEARTDCGDDFHVTLQDGDERCPVCFSRWWATDGSLPSAEGSYALGAVAAQALAAMTRELALANACTCDDGDDRMTVLNCPVHGAVANASIGEQ